MATLLGHAFVRRHTDVPLAANPAPTSQALTAGNCRQPSVPPEHPRNVSSCETDASIHTDEVCVPDALMGGVCVARWVACAQPTTVMMTDEVHYEARTVFESNDATPLLSVNTRLSNSTPLEISAVVVLERPMMEPLGCVVAQRLSRVNRCRLLELTLVELTR
jgi:hypothetical protein